MCARTGLLSILILMIPFVAVAQDEPLAVIMMRQGEVTIQRGGDALVGEFGMHLDLGDEVRTGDDSEADIFFATGEIRQLGANGSLVVQSSGNDSPSNVFRSADRLLQLRDSRGPSAIGRVRGGGSSAEIIAVSPRRTARLNERPVFQWSGGEGELELTIEHGGEVHWQGAVSEEGTFEYPEDAPTFAEGETYSWRVRTSDPLATAQAESQTAFFQTLTPEQEEELDSALNGLEDADVAASTRAVLMASILFEYGLVEEAIAIIDDAIEGSPDAEGLTAVRESLRGAYWP